MFEGLTRERLFGHNAERMYGTGRGIDSMRATRGRGFSFARRVAAAVLAVAAAAAGLALVAHGSPPTTYRTVVVQPGDTLWNIAAAAYPGDDPRVRVDDIEAANGLDGPVIRAGETLRLPG